MRGIGSEFRVVGGAADRRVAHFLVAAITRLERFDIDDVVELFGERIKMRDRRRGWDVAVVCVLLVIEKIEIGAAVWPLLALRERASGNGEDRDAGRKSDPFLHAGQADIEAPFVEVNRDSAERRDRVDKNQRGGRLFADDEARRVRLASFVTPVEVSLCVSVTAS